MQLKFWNRKQGPLSAGLPRFQLSKGENWAVQFSHRQTVFEMLRHERPSVFVSLLHCEKSGRLIAFLIPDSLRATAKCLEKSVQGYRRCGRACLWGPKCNRHSQRGVFRFCSVDVATSGIVGCRLSPKLPIARMLSVAGVSLEFRKETYSASEKIPASSLPPSR